MTIDSTTGLVILFGIVFMLEWAILAVLLRKPKRPPPAVTGALPAAPSDTHTGDDSRPRDPNNTLGHNLEGLNDSGVPLGSGVFDDTSVFQRVVDKSARAINGLDPPPQPFIADGKRVVKL